MSVEKGGGGVSKRMGERGRVREEKTGRKGGWGGEATEGNV